MYLSLLIFIISIIALVIGSLAYTKKRTPSSRHLGPLPPAPPQNPAPVPPKLPGMPVPFYIALENAFPQIQPCIASKIMGPGPMAEVLSCIPKDKPDGCDPNSWTLLAYPEVSKNLGSCFDEEDATAVCIKNVKVKILNAIG